MLKLAISPCPNDTFTFYGLLKGKTSFAPEIQTHFADIEDLNQLCLQDRDVDVCKISFHAFLYLRERFELLNTGSALGFGCGPLLVAHQLLPHSDLKKATIAIPGPWTTAALLLKLWLGPNLNLKTMRFDKIMPAVAAKEVDAGLIIHESRFTFPEYGLHLVVDLGDWWESETGCPIPLGGIVARKALGKTLISSFDDALGQSIDYAWMHSEEVTPFMQQHAQEMDPNVMRQHVALYVNQRTRNLGTEGRNAIETLFQKATDRGLLNS